MMFHSPANPSPSLRHLFTAVSLIVISSGHVMASSGWPDCDTTCTVTSYALENDTVQCLEDLAAYNCASLTLVDTCTMEQTLAFHVIGSGADTVTTCNATTAFGIGPDGALRLLGLSTHALVSSDLFLETDEGLTLTQYANGIAILQGEVANANNVDQRFEVFVVYENGTSGADWEGGFKHAMSCDPPTDTWEIYTIKPDQSHLMGRGDFEGSLLRLQHAPSSQFFGFQVGQGANDHNCNYGAGGWFSWSGTLFGQEVAGAMGDVIVDLDCASDFDPCTAQSVVYFSAYNTDCGVLEYSFDVLRVDDTPPVIAGLPQDTIVECLPEFPLLETVTATDNCPVPGFPVLTYEGVFEIEPSEGFCRSYEQRWRAEDECGNVTTASRLIDQFEDILPEMVGEEVVLIECDQWPGGFEPPFADLVAAGIIDAIDNCSIDTVLIEYGVMSGGCHYDHIMTYTPVDGCGNVGEAFYQIVAVDDTTPPTLVNVPADTLVSCTTDPAAVDVVPNAIDNCDPEVNMTFEVNYIDDGDGCDETFIIERVFIAEDCSYNHTLDTQYVHVADTAAPVITLSVPADFMAQGCFGDTDVSVSALGTAAYTAADDCGELTEVLTHSDGPLTEPCGAGGGSGSFQRTWTLTVTDCAGNASELQGIQTISVVDEQAPALEVANAVSLDCVDWYDGFNSDDAVSLGWVTASDHCMMDTLFVTVIGEFSSDCAGDWEVEYTAVDACGNDTTAAQIISLVDTTAPYFTAVPNDQELTCDGDPAPYQAGDAVAEDVCGSVSISTHDELVIEGCASSAVWERTITATDDCGNTATHVQQFARVDGVPPTISTWPADTSVTCALFAFDASEVVFSDDCDVAPTLEVTDDTVHFECPGTFTVERHFTVTDCTGNESEEIQVIDVLDTVAPVLVTSGVQIEISCSEWNCDIDQLASLGHVSATDNCGEVSLSVVCNQFSGGCLDPNGMLTLVYTAEDPCGNVTQAEQILLLIDTVAPMGSITCPADVSFELNSDCTYDLGAPDPAAPWGAPTVSALDNCDDAPELTLTHMDGAPQYACGDAGSMTIERTHTLISEDRCGNADTVTCVQTIELIDVTGPVITFDAPLPQNIFGCLADTDTSISALGALTATGTDACGGDVSVVVTHSDEVTASCMGDDGTPQGSSTLDRTFNITATDCGGNTSTAVHVQTVNFFDIAAPSVILVCPSDTTVASAADCSADLAPSLLGMPDVVASDNCDTDVAFTTAYTDAEFSAGCIGTRFYTRTFTVTAVDDCGQETQVTCAQDITVEDVTAPLISIACPETADIVLDSDCSWSGSSGQPAVVVSDGCDPAPSLEVSYTDHDTTQLCTGDDGMFEGSISFIRTFTATSSDACGNVATESCDQLVNLWDSAAPALHELETLSTDTLFLDAS